MAPTASGIRHDGYAAISARASVRGSALAHSSSNPIILSLKGLTTDPATPRCGAGEGGTEPGAPKRGRGGGWDDAAVAADDGEGEEGRGGWRIQDNDESCRRTNSRDENEMK